MGVSIEYLVFYARASSSAGAVRCLRQDLSERRGTYPHACVELLPRSARRGVFENMVRRKGTLYPPGAPRTHETPNITRRNKDGARKNNHAHTLTRIIHNLHMCIPVAVRWENRILIRQVRKKEGPFISTEYRQKCVCVPSARRRASNFSPTTF